MNRTRISRKSGFAWLAAMGACATLLVGAFIVWSAAQAQDGMLREGPAPRQMGAPGGSGARKTAPPKPFPFTLTIEDGTSVSYRVREQLVGIDFPDDAVGRSTAVTGTIVFNRDGSIDSSRSKLTFDLRTLKSDQPMRDGFIQKRTLQTERYPTAVFVPKTIEGMPDPLKRQFGFRLTGDMTIHGVTAPVSWQGYATVDNNSTLVAGRASTEFKFETFGLAVPKLARLLSVNDNIALEVEFRCKVN
ncbi:MAG TPA: YceI family protein [Patescibacteria group bacterium]|nr:YceI family protein [Patescibacteria group bacterium]